MRKVVLAVVALAVLAIGSTALAGSADVNVTGTGFAPATVAVQSGDTVNWTNSDKVSHQVDVAGGSCKLALAAGQSARVRPRTRERSRTAIRPRPGSPGR